MFLRSLTTALCCTVLATASLAQDSMKPDSSKPLASPPAVAQVMLSGKAIKITYNSPSIRGRKIMGGLVPYGQVWRTGANPATTLTTGGNMKFGTLDVPAGTYTIYTLPGESQWLLIINKQTKQWGTVYNQDRDLGRTAMTGESIPVQQEKMSISFEHTHGNRTELHIRWENTDEFVPIVAQ